MNQAIINKTPHTIDIDLGDGVRVTIPPTAPPARVLVESETIGRINDIPVVRTKYGAVEGLPHQQDGVMYIVSLMVQQALPARTDLLRPDSGPTAIRDSKGQIEAVRTLVSSAGLPEPAEEDRKDNQYCRCCVDYHGDCVPSDNGSCAM